MPVAVYGNRIVGGLSSGDERNGTSQIKTIWQRKDGEQDASPPDAQGSNVEYQGAAEEVPSMEEKEVLKDQGEAQETIAENAEETIEHENPPLKGTQEASQPDLVKTKEDAIRDALSRRAAELKSQAETLTVTNVRHLLEEDLGLERDGLNVHKQLIRTLVDQLLGAATEEPNLDQLPKKQETAEETPANSKGRLKNKEGKPAKARKSTLGEAIEHIEQDVQEDFLDSVSDETRSNKPKKRKKKDFETKRKPLANKSTDAKRPFSPKVERIREILKFVGIGVSPIVYKKAKQAPDHERETVLIKELENLLAQEGLSSSPTEKEMRKVKARREKKRDLDGIERSNIVEEPRRSRAAASSWFAPRPNKYALAQKDSEGQDSDDDLKPVVTEAMDD